MYRVILVFFIYLSTAFANDTTFVKPSELEPNRGFWFFRGIDGPEVSGSVNTIINCFQVSSNGRYLAYIGYQNTIEGKYGKGNKFHFIDLQNNTEIYSTTYPNDNIHDFWFKDTNTVVYFYFPPYDGSGKIPFYKLVLLNLLTFKTDSLYCRGGGDTSCYFLNTLGPDGKGYLSYLSSKIYGRLNIDSSFKIGFPVHEKIPGYSNDYSISSFPPCDTNFTLSLKSYPIDYKSYPHGFEYVLSGFSVVKNFDYQNHQTDIIIPLPQDTSCKNETGGGNPWNVSFGPDGVIYFGFMVLSNKEIARGLPVPPINEYPFDSIMLAARAKSGIYRIDTCGKNLIQLVRDWGGMNCIHTTCDGTIFYQMINWEDTTAAIWKMNKYGKDKQMVFNLKKQVSSVNPEHDYTVKKDIISILNSINKNEISIIINKNFNELIEFTVFDLYGKRIKQFSNQYSNKVIALNTADFIDGIYFLTYHSGKYSGALKFIILH